MSAMSEAGNTTQAVGEVTSAETIQQILDAAALRDDLPPDFHKLPVATRQKILGLTGPEQGE